MKDAAPRTIETADSSLPPTGVDGIPTLVLAFADFGRREVETVSLGSGPVIIGRDESVFPSGPLDDEKLSRRHASIGRDGARWVVRDLGSRNGTRVNGQRLDAQHALKRGDVLRAGRTLIVFTYMRPDADATVTAAPGLVGRSDALAGVRKAISAVARARRTVLVTGETGTGKEVVASGLHAHSERPGRFVAVNCGSFVEGVLESELFGHVRGSFTGATADRAGLFRAADRGTLFLDEIGELPLGMQAKLLRVLETGLVRPVGSSNDVATDVAIISATNRDTIADVRSGRFRADLYARLAQWLIRIPPLRDRREDIPLLVRHLLARVGAADRTMSMALAESLLMHNWPLNVRGLLNVLSIAAVASPTDGPLDLTVEVREALDSERALTVSEPPTAEGKANEPKADELKQALLRFKGDVTATSRHFACSRQQLYRWIQKQGLDLSTFR